MIRVRLYARQAFGEVLYKVGLRRLPPSSLSVLMYHAVVREDLQDPLQESICARQFETQMATLRNLGVEIVSLGEGIQRLARGSEARPAVSIVFDDGYVGVHDHALEALLRHRIPATLFLVSGYMGRPVFPWASPQLGRPLTWMEVATLVKGAGCEVGSHTHTHAILTQLKPQAIRRELHLSRDAIQHHLGVIPRLFAYPYGSYGAFNAQTRQILLEEGFSVACTTIWGRHLLGDDPLSVKRLRVSWSDTAHEVRKSLAGCYDWYRFVQRLQTAF